jgi:hypothetical protein
MNKHTPGPWFIDYEGGGSMGRRALLENADGECVGYLYEAEFEDERLIAAAPELLQMLQEIVNKNLLNGAMLKDARAVIAEATGETK